LEYYPNQFGNVLLNPVGTLIAPNQYRYPANTTVSLSVSPNAGFEFKYWELPTGFYHYTPLTLTLNTNTTVVVYFTVHKVLLIDYGGIPEGRVQVNGTPYDLPVSFNASVGNTIDLFADVPTGYIFEKWEIYERNPDGTVGSLVNVVYDQLFTLIVDRSYVIKMYIREN
jgi:hypothetical protein